MSSRNERKRKREVDTSAEADDRSPERSSRKESRRSSRRHERDDSQKSTKPCDNANEEPREGGGDDSLSIEETNKLRAKLGLSPLDVDGSAVAATNKPDIQLDEGESLFTEDGVSIVHKAPRNMATEKISEKAKERLETAKQKRKVESKVLKVRRGIADSGSDDESASTWVERNRKLEEELRKTREKAKELDELDEAFGVGGLLEKEQRIMNRPKKVNGNASLTSGLVVGHSKEAFANSQETVLVLQDKGVLDEDEDEVLINPNLIENERHKRNVELRKKKGATGYNPYEDCESVDEFGQLKKKDILDKYDEVLDGEEPKREKFRLDSTGGYDLDKETREVEMRRKLLMANKKFETLEMARPMLAREFYTEEEMISFRRPKKKKDTNKIRKRKTLKASDLEPENGTGETEAEQRLRAEKLAARRGEPVPTPLNNEAAAAAVEALTNGVSDEKLEDGELTEECSASAPLKAKWKEAAGAAVDVAKLRELAERSKHSSKRQGKHSKSKEKNVKEEPVESEEDEESSDDDNFIGGVDLTSVVLEDDAEDELRFSLERNRRLKQVKVENGGDNVNNLTGVERIRALLSAASKIKDEVIDLDEEESGYRKIVFDATSEQYKTIGEIPTLGLAGNREDGVDYSNLLAPDEADDDKRENDAELGSKHGEDSDDDMILEEIANMPSSSREKDESDDDTARYENVLGEEKDVSKGVGAMLKLAGVKGYLESGAGRRTGDGTLKHLESQRFSRVEQGRYDIEDKTMRKLERMGTTGTGPVRAFPEKVDYKPDVEVSYSDSKGRLMSEKEAFRALSWKFHGKGPGKKQIEKHQAQLEKKERLKKMNSMDTPLGTLSKQRKKQEQLQTPYLILSGTGKDGAPLQKD